MSSQGQNNTSGASGTTGTTPRSTRMSELVQLIRQKLIREPNSHNQSGSSTTSSSTTTTVTANSLKSTHCWLCAAETQSQFHCVENQPLCLGCFQICYTATLRPQLLGDSQGYELAERLNAAENFSGIPSPTQKSATQDNSGGPQQQLDNTASSGTCLMSSQSMLDGTSSAMNTGASKSMLESTNGGGGGGGLWRCHRCTYNNPNYLSYCEVCDAGSPLTVNCNHCGVSCSNVNASPLRSTINRSRGAAGVTGSSSSGPGSGNYYPPPTPPLGGKSGPLIGAQGHSMCSAYKMEHEVWECEKCTYINTLACKDCTVCNSSRMWTCSQCNYEKNTSRCGKKGERHCTKCGCVHVAAKAVNTGAGTTGAKPPTTAPIASAPPAAPAKKDDDTLSDSVMRRIGLDPAEAKRERERGDRLEQNKNRLLNRLHSLGLNREIQLGDGNCQFRGLSHQLFGTPEHHMLLRHLVMLHIWKERSFYELLFDNETEFTRYWKTMSMSGTWGDEITLRAAADTFGVHLHVITSDEVRWHLHFAPENAEPTEVIEEEATSGNSVPTGFSKLSHKKESHLPHLFLLYLAPVHYDDIVRPARLPNFSATLTAILKKLKADEADWDDAMEHPTKKRSMNNDVEWVEVTPQSSTYSFGGSAGGGGGLSSPAGIPVSSMTFQGPSSNVTGHSAMVMVNHGSGSKNTTTTNGVASGSSNIPGSPVDGGSGAPHGKIKIRLSNPQSQK